MTSVGDWRNGVYNEQNAVEVRFAILNHARDAPCCVGTVYVPYDVAEHAAIQIKVGKSACATWACAHHHVAGLYVGVAVMGDERAHDEDDEFTLDKFTIREDSPSHLGKFHDSQLSRN